MKVTIGEMTLELTEAQEADLRQQLGGIERSEGLIDASALAQRLGVSREYVYAHAKELGGRKIGDGPKAPWRFDPARLEAMKALSDPKPESPETPFRSRRKRRAPQSGPLLEIRGKAP